MLAISRIGMLNSIKTNIKVSVTTQSLRIISVNSFWKQQILNSVSNCLEFPEIEMLNLIDYQGKTN